MKPKRILLFLCLIVLSITACTVQPEVSAEAMPTAILTETPVPPTATSSPVPTKTVEPQPESIATPLPTQPSFIITPNPSQVTKWKEYEEALSKELLNIWEDNAAGDAFICEWLLLGDEPGKLYAWVKCYGYFLSEGIDTHSSRSTPAVILIDENNDIVEILTPWDVSTSYNEGVSILFPEELRDVTTKHRTDIARLSDHLDYRLEHPEEPPLIVLDATPSPDDN